MKRYLILLLGVFVVGAAPAKGIKGSGEMKTETRNVSGFSSVSFRCSGDLEIIQGEEESLTITGDKNLLPYIETEVDDGELIISTQGRYFGLSLRPTRELKFVLKLKTLEEFNLHGAGDVTSKNLKGTNLDLELSGSGSIHILELAVNDLALDITGSGEITLEEFSGKEVDIDVAGSGEVEIAGQVESQEISISGSGNVRTGKLECSRAEVHISGSGDVVLRARDELEASVSGSGDVSYYGSPKLHSRHSGSGEIQSLGD